MLIRRKVWLLYLALVPFTIALVFFLTLSISSVRAAPPVVATGCTANGSNPGNALVNTSVNFNVATISGGDGVTYFYSWTFGDGGPISNLRNPTHQYTTTGTMVAVLSVDSPGATSNAQCIVVIDVSNTPPPTPLPSITPVGNPLCFSQTPRLQGLLSTPSLSGQSKFGNNGGNCVVDPIQAGIVSFKIPSYADLKNTYFERKASVTTGSNLIDKQIIAGDQTNLDFHGGNGNKLWNITGNLNLTACPSSPGPLCSGNRSAVIFVDKNLNIGDLNISSTYPSSSAPNLDVQYDNATAGIVYVVKGNVSFGRNVRRFDGIIIAQGTICTSVDNAPCPSGQKDAHFITDPGGETKQLTINGNLISLDSANPIKFQRNLIFSTCGGSCPDGNDTTPAEVVNAQPKYLVIMKDLLSEVYSIPTEDTHYALNQ